MWQSCHDSASFHTPHPATLPPGCRYLTGYNSTFIPHVPPGWDRWFVFSDNEFYNYTVSDQVIVLVAALPGGLLLPSASVPGLDADAAWLPAPFPLQGKSKSFANAEDDYSTGGVWQAAWETLSSWRDCEAWQSTSARRVRKEGRVGAAGGAALRLSASLPSADVVTAHGVEFIQQVKDDSRPFFLYLAPCEWPARSLAMCPC